MILIERPYMFILASVCLLVSVILMRTSVFIDDIELKQDDSKDEQKWVSTMLILFSV